MSRWKSVDGHDQPNVWIFSFNKFWNFVLYLLFQVDMEMEWNKFSVTIKSSDWNWESEPYWTSFSRITAHTMFLTSVFILFILYNSIHWSWSCVQCASHFIHPFECRDLNFYGFALGTRSEITDTWQYIEKFIIWFINLCIFSIDFLEMLPIAIGPLAKSKVSPSVLTFRNQSYP